jgi:glycosyltransferase involved in cell wall biosynthesis
MKINKVSIVICCFNSRKVIAETLVAALEQNTKFPYEIIVINNNSNDDTVNIVKEVYKSSTSKVDLKIINETKPGLVFARIVGFMNAKFDLVSFVDDDNIIDSNWIDELSKVFDDKKVGVAGGYNSPIAETGCSLPSWFEIFQSKYACGPQAESSMYVTQERKYLFGAGLTFRKEVLKEIYDSELPLFLTGRKSNSLLAGDDAELCLRAALNGWELWYEQSLKLKHLITMERLTWGYLLKNQKGHSAALNILDIYISLLNKEVPLTNFYYVKNRILHGWKKYIFNTIKKRKLLMLFKKNNWTSITFSHLAGWSIFLFKHWNYVKQTRKEITEYYAK